MKEKLLLYLLIVVVNFNCQCSFAQTNTTDYGRYIVNELASEKFHGRGYVRRGELKSARFIAKEFKQMNLEPINGDYFQYFKLPVNTFPTVCDVIINQNKNLIPGKDYIVAPFSGSGKGNFEVVTYEKYSAGEVQYSRSKPFVHIDLTTTKAYNKIISQLNAEKNLELSGVIVTGFEKLTWSTAVNQLRFPVIYILGNHELNQINIRLKARFNPDYQSQNVLATIKGEITDSLIVVSAHYDHLGRMGRKTLFPGANDNASGVAQMLALARYFSVNPPKYSLCFVAFGGEEAGLHGSIRLSSTQLLPLNKIKFMLNLDIAGTGDEGIQIVNSTVHKDQFRIMQSLNDHNQWLSQLKTRGEACNSDHCPFHRHGVKSFFIYTLGGIQAYHDIDDRPETLPLTAFSECFELYKAFIERL